MRKYGVSRSTTASPEAVWRVWSDPNNWSSWNSGIKSAQVAGPLADGVTGVMTTREGGTYSVRFHDVVPQRGFSLSMNGPMSTITFVCEIAPAGSGSTIAQSATFSGPIAFLLAPMMGPTMAKHFVPVLDDLATTAEATG